MSDIFSPPWRERFPLAQNFSRVEKRISSRCQTSPVSITKVPTSPKSTVYNISYIISYAITFAKITAFALEARLLVIVICLLFVRAERGRNTTCPALSLSLSLSPTFVLPFLTPLVDVEGSDPCMNIKVQSGKPPPPPRPRKKRERKMATCHLRTSPFLPTPRVWAFGKKKEIRLVSDFGRVNYNSNTRKGKKKGGGERGGAPLLVFILHTV